MVPEADLSARTALRFSHYSETAGTESPKVSDPERWNDTLAGHSLESLRVDLQKRSRFLRIQDRFKR
jgi:hypothetical protein